MLFLGVLCGHCASNLFSDFVRQISTENFKYPWLEFSLARGDQAPTLYRPALDRLEDYDENFIRVEFRLWDVERRRQPPLPAQPKPKEEVDPE